MTEVEQADQLKKLTEPFEKHQINLLPKPCKKDSPKGRCNECGGYHGLPAVHLDYVGHAALTNRLLEVDPLWNWEPFSVGEDGLPKLDNIGGLWIKLTICGLTRMGYGDAQGKKGTSAIKEIIGDALRNAAMRFGAALDLWHKGELHIEDEGEPEPSKKDLITEEELNSLDELIDGNEEIVTRLKQAYKVDCLSDLTSKQYPHILKRLKGAK